MDANQISSPKALTIWAWLFPLTYLIHIAEELWGGEGYPAYIKRLRGVDLTPTRFLVGQLIALALIVAGIFVARRFNFPRQLLVMLGAVVLINGLSHLGTSLYYGEYGPGLASGVLIWIPLGIGALASFKRTLSANRYWLYVSIGLAINLAVAAITLKGGRMR